MSTTATEDAEANTWPYRKQSVINLAYAASHGLYTPVSGDVLAKKGQPYVN